MKFQKTIAIALSVAALLTMTACGSTSEPAAAAEQTTQAPKSVSGTVSLAGSTSMQKLCEAMIESFSEEYPDITVTVTSTNPAEAELIANTIAKILPDRIAEIVDGSSVRIVDYAIIPSHRSSPSMVKNTAMGILAGGFLAAAWVVVRFLLNDKSKMMIQSADDLRAAYPDMMVLAMIPDMRVSDKKNGYYSNYYYSSDTDSKKKKEGVKHARSKKA